MKLARERTPGWGFGFASATIAVSCLLAAVPATAIEIRSGQNVVVGADEVIVDDLYASGDTVTVDGRIEGDFVATGREIRMNGEVTGDMIAAGQAVVVDGRVGDDVRMAGMALQLGPRAAVGDDIVSAGLSLETQAGSVTQGSLFFSAMQVLLAGDVSERLSGSASAVELRGRIGGDSEIDVEDESGMLSFAQFIPSPVPLPAVPAGLTIADTTRIEGELVYTSSSEAQGSGTGTLIRQERKRVSPETAEGEAVRRSKWPGRFFGWLGLVILGLLLGWRCPAWLNGRADEIRSKPLPLAGLGLVGVAALPVGMALILVVVVLVTVLLALLKLSSLAALTLVLGLVGLGLLSLLFWLTFTYLAPILVGLCAGRWVVARVAAERASEVAIPLVAGLLILALLRSVPVLGVLVTLAVLFLGWGVILAWLWRRSRTAKVEKT